MISNILIDFDSTIISCEIMEVLWKIALNNSKNKDTICKQIEIITNKGMNWEIWFSESLNQRLKLLPLTYKIIQQTIDFIKPKISKSFVDNIHNLKKFNYHIISWWFTNVINPLMIEIWLSKDRIHANELFFDKEKYLWIDTLNLLSQDKWKVKKAQSLDLKWKTVIVWDGYTDYEIKQFWYANKFYYYAENIYRDKVVKFADKIIYSFDELFEIN